MMFVSGLRVPAVVMVRPRGGDFAYSKREKKWMLTTIKQVAKLGFQGVVLGALVKKQGRCAARQRILHAGL